MRRRLLAAFLLATSLLAAGAAPAVAAGLPEPIGLNVVNGSGWHARNDFTIRWDADRRSRYSADSTHYELLSPSGAVIDHREFREDPGSIPHIEVPSATPGTSYRAVVWFETQKGPGPAAAVSLLFDNLPPAAPRVVASAGWLAATSPASITLEPSPADAPASGLRGYAISINRGPVLDPCAGEDLCTEAETDVGAGTRILPFGNLPEGIYSVGAVAVSGSGVRSSLATTTLRVDASRPEVALTSLPSGWSPDPVALSAVAADPLSGMAPAGPDGPFTAIAVDGGAPKRAPGASVSTVVAGDGVHEVAFWGRDALGNSGEPGVALARRRPRRCGSTAPSPRSPSPVPRIPPTRSGSRRPSPTACRDRTRGAVRSASAQRAASAASNRCRPPSKAPT